MAQSVLVIADSGTGKSTSIRKLDPKETFIINIANKPLPFKGWKKNYSNISKDNPKGNMTSASSAPGIIKAMQHVNDKMPQVKTLVVDDWQYMSSFEYFDRANEKGYDKFTSIAANLAQVAKMPKDMREDLTIFFLTHSEESTDVNGNRRVKAKTVGKMIDNALTLEGLFSIVLFGKVKKTEDGLEYGFDTQNNGENTCKSPMGMFEESFINNDLQFVKDCIINYEN
ncbi:MAG: AAA family ATPase [Flavobacteriales bacterium]|nr:AAA family ATPase [Flavobacteriales bacterium]